MEEDRLVVHLKSLDRRRKKKKEKKTPLSYVTVTKKIQVREIPWVKPEQRREAQNLLSPYEKNSKTTRRYWCC